MYIKRIFFLKRKKNWHFGAWSNKVQISEPSEALLPTRDIPSLGWQERVPHWRLGLDAQLWNSKAKGWP